LHRAAGFRSKSRDPQAPARCYCVLRWANNPHGQAGKRECPSPNKIAQDAFCLANRKPDPAPPTSRSVRPLQTSLRALFTSVSSAALNRTTKTSAARRSGSAWRHRKYVARRRRRQLVTDTATRTTQTTRACSTCAITFVAQPRVSRRFLRRRLGVLTSAYPLKLALPRPPAQRLSGWVGWGMVFLRFAWRLASRRWTRRVLLWLIVRLTRWVGWRRAVRLLLLWLVVRLIRLFGWRRAVRLLFRGASHWRLLVAAVWRATVLLLRAGRSALTLAGWARARRSASLNHRTTNALRSTDSPKPRRLSTADRRSGGQLVQELRTTLPSRVARRRDEIRRSLLAAFGVDPNWRPPSRRTAGATSAVDRKPRPELGASSSR
jgi:hypothetical protein